ncbi:acyl-CoA dehydratase activase [Desulfurispira natronophila]|uniref:Putative CoA-substrate-specific enzyme activase n=1 Tax=Desulfurispira natronophila TaxID=682562 RepID=A0A7W7Y681_9BACT|nr:acyl-CoA dehydratase activase [Desulfurispira natronophila]MBB5022689.1 putative CoA-substrate-specific enzyme activase [Desulfurispira natronophila]
MYDLGVDIGSVSINAVVIDQHGSLVFESPYRRHYGQVDAHLQQVLHELQEYCQPHNIRCTTFTGTLAERPAALLECPFEVETIAQVVGTLQVVPGVSSIISIGGQDAGLFQVKYRTDGQWYLDAFNMNGPCASGTGSFIDQQAQRLASAIYGGSFDTDSGSLNELLQDFMAMGRKSTKPAPVACRCTVFTKSDMIHLQNKGESLANIIAGLHAGNAANYMSTMVGNRQLDEPIVFIGGMASNDLQVDAFLHYFPGLQIPPHYTSLGALGAARQSQLAGRSSTLDIQRLQRHLSTSQEPFPCTSALELELTHFHEDNSLPVWAPSSSKATPGAYLGIDIGSTSTKYALIDEEGNLIGKCYRPTQGKPIEVAQQLIQHLMEDAGRYVRLLGVATTGSGRNVVGDFISADLILDEITAHATGAVSVDPEVETIFEIGGQDSKYIRIERTYPVDFVMNKVCAAGTGSFLQELASKMGINISGEFQEVALSSSAPVHLAERCTVFMESDMASYAQKGAPRNDLIAGLCYAIVHNYLHRVVENRPVGKKVMFLGGPSLNKAVVAAFERITQRPVLVPRHREVMGAYGAALAVREHHAQGVYEPGDRDLKALQKSSISARESICRAVSTCHNECKLQIYQFGSRKSIWGGDCGRYEVTQHHGPSCTNFFQQRQELFHQALLDSGAIFPESANLPQAGTIGLPMSLHALDWGVFWAHVLQGTGLQVVLTPPTNHEISMRGVESMSAETCYPVKVYHGHVHLLARQAQWIFMPNVINVPVGDSHEKGCLCPLVEGAQFMTKAALGLDRERIVSPTVHLKDGPELVALALWQGLPPSIRPTRGVMQKVVQEAWQRQMDFRKHLQKIGRQYVDSISPDTPLWIITGRPYNLYDERLNLQIGRHLAKLGIEALPMDFLDLDGEDISDFPRMYWGLGGRILKTARAIHRHPNWFGLHITNFSCGADSFIEHFYQHILHHKPSLILELDEHSGVAGTLTRVEAYRNVVKNIMGQ